MTPNFSWKFKHADGAENRRFSQETADWAPSSEKQSMTDVWPVPFSPSHSESLRTCCFVSGDLKSAQSELHVSEKHKRGWKTRGRGKHTIEPLSKKGFGPPTYDMFPPPSLFTPCHLLWRKRAQTRQIPLSEASNSGSGWGHSIVRSPPPPKIARYNLPPH